MLFRQASRVGKCLRAELQPGFRLSRLHSTHCSSSNTFHLRNSLMSSDGESLSKTAFESSTALSWYSCGPTVYDSSHMGHARTYVCTDIIRRTMVDYFNIRMNYAMGITDIDDKIINKGRASGMLTWGEMQTMVRRLEDDFFRDMDALNVLRPDTVLRVTEHIPEIIAYITKLVELKSAYVADDGVYFDFSSLKNAYDKFGSAHVSNIEEDTDNTSFQSSAQIHSKRSAKDFALWKLHKGPTSVSTSADHAKECVWESPWGAGRPGWHIECSAMTHSLFGEHIDIHSGGVDLQFPHHTNEIAQCEAHNCSEHNAWVGSWIHLGHLHIEGRKMSKSLKNFVSIEDYLRSGLTSHPADDFRLYCLQHKYHSTLTYSPSRVEEAARFRTKVESFGSSLRSAVALLNPTAGALKEGSISASGVQKVGLMRKPTAESARLGALLRRLQEEVHEALRDDFDTPRALNALSQLVGEATLYLQLLLAAVPAEAAAVRAGLVVQPIEPLLAANAYVHRILTIFGLQFPHKQPPHHLLRAGEVMQGGAHSSAGLSDDAIDSILQFRAQVRAAALVGMKAVRAQKKTQALTPLETQLEENYQQILTNCDVGRDQLGAALGVKVEDLTGSASKWTKL